MKSRQNVLALGLSLACFGTALWISSCGQPVCVAGIGQCDGLAGSKESITSSRRGGRLSVTSNAPNGTTRLNSAVTITVSGGTPPYRYNILPTDYAVLTPFAAGGRGGLYQYTLRAVRVPPQTLSVSFTDSGNPLGTGVINITVTN